VSKWSDSGALNVTNILLAIITMGLMHG